MALTILRVTASGEPVPGTGTPDSVTRRMVKVIEQRRQKGSGF
jgi:hypothetical protein